jgi:hypothetical protein
MAASSRASSRSKYCNAEKRPGALSLSPGSFFMLTSQDLGAQDLGAQDLGAQDLGAQDLGAQDLGSQDLGAQDLERRT